MKSFKIHVSMDFKYFDFLYVLIHVDFLKSEWLIHAPVHLPRVLAHLYLSRVCV